MKHFSLDFIGFGFFTVSSLNYIFLVLSIISLAISIVFKITDHLKKRKNESTIDN
jgi:hypothetical protein